MIMKFKLTILIILAVLSVGCQNVSQDKETSLELDKDQIKQEETRSATVTPEIESVEISGAEVKEDVQETEIPDFLDYPVAFVSQAPYAVWDELHQEACEEAAMITVAKYFKGEPLTAHTMEQAILDLVHWEETNGYQVDLTASETLDILSDYFNLQARLIIDVTAQRIKEELVKGNLIIIPAAGRQLGNPYFQTPGPIYHMLVIRGYDNNTGEFITNDVGTKRGDGFRYKYQKLISAIHDWDHGLAMGGMTDEEMEQGRKVMILVSK